MILLIGILLTMLLVFVMIVRECAQYVRKRQTYPIRRLTLRVSTAIMLLFLLASILVGVRAFHLGSPEDNGYVQLWAAFWGAVVLLVFGIFCLVIADMRTVSVETNRTPINSGAKLPKPSRSMRRSDRKSSEPQRREDAKRYHKFFGCLLSSVELRLFY